MMEDGLDLAPAKVVSEKEDVVRIMSIHQSKGLEFPVVIVADMGKEFNRMDLHEPILFHNELGIGLKQYDSAWRMFYPTLIWSGIEAKLRWEGTAEEERVLYVAMTRPDQLILIGHDSKAADHWARWLTDSIRLRAIRTLIGSCLRWRTILETRSTLKLSEPERSGKGTAGSFASSLRNRLPV